MPGGGGVDHVANLPAQVAAGFGARRGGVQEQQKRDRRGETALHAAAQSGFCNTRCWISGAIEPNNIPR